MEKEIQKQIRLLYFWSDLYNFTIGLLLVGQSRSPDSWMLMFSGVTFSIITTAPTLYSLTRRTDEDYQVRWK